MKETPALQILLERHCRCAGDGECYLHLFLIDVDNVIAAEFERGYRDGYEAGFEAERDPPDNAYDLD